MNRGNWLVIGCDWHFSDSSAGRMDFGFLAQKPCQVLFYLFLLNSYDEFREQNGIQCVLTMPENNIVMDDGRDIAIFRIMQEALTNIALHSRATNVTLDVEIGTNNLMMKITDDGCGMSKAQMRKPGKYGILGMHERARHFGGTVTIASNPGKGTTLVLNMQLKSGCHD